MSELAAWMWSISVTRSRLVVAKTLMSSFSNVVTNFGLVIHTYSGINNINRVHYCILQIHQVSCFGQVVEVRQRTLLIYWAADTTIVVFRFQAATTIHKVCEKYINRVMLILHIVTGRNSMNMALLIGKELTKDRRRAIRNLHPPISYPNINPPCLSVLAHGHQEMLQRAWC